MKTIDFTGKSINEAVDKAHEELGIAYADIDFEVIEEASKGFLGIGAKPAKIRVTIKEAGDDVKEAKPEPKREAMSAKPERRREVKKPAPKSEPVQVQKAETEEPVQTKEPVQTEEPVPEVKDESQGERANLTEEDKSAIISSAVDFLNCVFAQMGMKVDLQVTFDDNKHLFINMEGEDMGTIIGKRGQTLDSLQYLTNLVVNKGEYPYMNVTLDTEDYRAKRKKTLETLAFNLAKKAKHNRRNVTLEPMNPYERRIIHATLQNDRYVTTYSEGVEPYRYVVIALKSNYGKKNNY